MQLRDELFIESVMNISIHAPYKGCNNPAHGRIWEYIEFQSMHPIKDATILMQYTGLKDKFQSMHPIKDATRTI